MSAFTLTPEQIRSIVQELGGPSREARVSVIERLTQIGAPALPELCRVLLQGKPAVRADAAELLGHIGDPRAVGPLSAALLDRETAVRWAAAVALGKLGDPRAVTPLTGAVRKSPPPVRAAAAEALGKLGDARGVPPLVELLKCGEPALQIAAASALGRLGHEGATPALCNALRSFSEAVVLEAARSLGAIGDVRAVPYLCAAVTNRWPREPHLTSIFTQALVALGPGAIDALAADLSARSGNHGAVKALASFGAASAPALEKALRHASVQVRQQALVAISMATEHEPEMARCAVVALTDARPEHRAEALRLVGELRDPELAERIQPMLRDPVPSVRSRAALALLCMKRRDEPLVACLVEAFKDPNASVAEEAVRWVAVLAREDPDPTLRSALGPLRKMQLFRPMLGGACREAIQAIEASTGRLSQLPVPAATGRDEGALPIPASAARSSAADLPLPGSAKGLHEEGAASS